MPTVDSDITPVEDEAGVAACFSLRQQLRPHLSGTEEFIARWRRQSQTDDGYRLIALFHERQPVSLAGFRIQDNLVHGRHLYVDDLVTDRSRRSCGLGEQLLQHLMSLGRATECSKLVFDTPLTNVLGHRFYYRQGLLASALRFNVSLT